MSFSSQTKEELCRNPVKARCCSIAESYGILLCCNTFSAESIKIVTENAAFAERLPHLFKRAFGLNFDEVPDKEEQAKFTFLITDREKLNAVASAFGYEPGGILAHHINLGILEENCCRQSFLRGAFLSGGSITDPEKRYHLELVTGHYNVSRELSPLMQELGLEAKSISRSGNYVVYLKQSDSIEDFLTAIGAPVAAMDVMNAKIIKDMTNSVNRRVNCDTANVEKTVDAAQEQVAAIRKLEKSIGLEALPDKLRETAQLRLENPELSLSQLAELAVPPVSKSCINHRLHRLTEMAGLE